MKTLFVYQIIDSLSENILRTFLGPNDRLAENLFFEFCSGDGMKNADLSDICLIRCADNSGVFESYRDYSENFDDSDGAEFLWYGNDLVEDRKHES